MLNDETFSMSLLFLNIIKGGSFNPAWSFKCHLSKTIYRMGITWRRIITHTGIFSVFPKAVIKDDQNPSTPVGRWLGDIAIDTLNRTSEMSRALKFQIQYITGTTSSNQNAEINQSFNYKFKESLSIHNLNNAVDWNRSCLSVI